jgi:hypothetical protein
MDRLQRVPAQATIWTTTPSRILRWRERADVRENRQTNLEGVHMDKHLQIALMYASKTVRKLLAPLSTLEELTPELREELIKLQKEMKAWVFYK